MMADAPIPPICVTAMHANANACDNICGGWLMKAFEDRHWRPLGLVA